MLDKQRIMVVEDEPALGKLLLENLEGAGYASSLVTDGLEALDRFRTDPADLCILDVMLPKLDGFHLAREIRQIDHQAAFLFLTARGAMADKEQGFRLGADDYLTKPFRVRELLLRINAILERTRGPLAGPQRQIDLGAFQLRIRDRVLVIGSQEIKLTNKEMQIMQLLSVNLGTTVAREHILEKVWGKNDPYFSKSLDVYLHRIRKYLCKGHGISLNNVYGVGFALYIDQGAQ